MGTLEHDELWGAPLESYVGFYTLDAAKKRSTITPENVSEAQLGIRKLCRLGAPHGRMPDMEDVEAYWVSALTLKTILKLAESPHTFSQLANPTLITACTRMMASVMPAGRTSPFTYEFGYLCFRLITIVVGVSILERSGNLEMTIANMVSDTETELLLTFSGHVSRVIQEEYETPNDVDDCDWILGWLEDSERGTLDPLVGQQDVVLLMNMIWEDRKPFLSALSHTYSPGLSAIMFVFWRCMEFGRHLPIVERVQVPLREILWRYVLVATTDQVTPLMHIHNAVGGLTERWDETPKFVDLEDSRTIINVYCTRLAPVDTRMYSPIAISAIPAMMRFVVPHVAPEAQDLLPLIFGRTVERTWGALITDEEDNEHFVDYLGKIMFSSR
ncbi:hypothetical protein FRC11_011390 [Ceratobasidium sp. 423]|nr:hypothetical protein FRC11_011390 [Ceratobasidium sp. 423]